MFNALLVKNHYLPNPVKYHWMDFIAGQEITISSSPFYKHGLTLIPAWISNHMPGKVWDEITYPFLNFNSCTVEV